jgi:DNA-binding response OmpR family regulator
MSKRILILDDEIDSNITVEAVLQDSGYKVDSYDDPILALEKFKSYFYDLVILDIKMPQMDGFVVYNEIKKLDNMIKSMFLDGW